VRDVLLEGVLENGKINKNKYYYELIELAFNSMNIDICQDTVEHVEQERLSVKK